MIRKFREWRRERDEQRALELFRRMYGPDGSRLPGSYQAAMAEIDRLRDHVDRLDQENVVMKARYGRGAPPYKIQLPVHMRPMYFMQMAYPVDDYHSNPHCDIVRVSVETNGMLTIHDRAAPR